jgi:hypothetical protein
VSLPTTPQSRAGMPPRRARVLLGAAGKTGKTSTLAEWAPKTTLIVDTQHGTNLLDGDHYVSHVADYPGFVSVVDDLVRTRHMFHTVGLDLTNDLWRFADLHHGKTITVEGVRMQIPASGVDDYGRSLAKARTAFLGQIGRLLAAPIGVWFLTHLHEKTDKDGQLVVYVPKLDKNVYSEIAGAVDFVFLAEVEPNGRRVVHTQPTRHFEAGSRVRMPSPLPLNAAEIACAMDRALNPQEYNEDGSRKRAEDRPEPVTPTEQEPAAVEPERQDIDRTGTSDLPPSDLWLDSIRARTKDYKGGDYREALAAIGAPVPERVSSWGRVLADLNASQRAALDAEVTRRLDAGPVPWTDEQHDAASADAEAQLDIDEARSAA